METTEMDERKDFADKKKAELHEARSLLDNLKTRAQGLAGTAREELQEGLDGAEETWDSLKRRVGRLAESGDDAWDSLKDRVDVAWDDLTERTRSLSRKITDRGTDSRDTNNTKEG
jgi:hypothetical protein